MAGKAVDIHDPVTKEEIELTDKESKQYQEIISTAIQLEESYNKVVAEIQEDYKRVNSIKRLLVLLYSWKRVIIRL